MPFLDVVTIALYLRLACNTVTRVLYPTLSVAQVQYMYVSAHPGHGGSDSANSTTFWHVPLAEPDTSSQPSLVRPSLGGNPLKHIQFVMYLNTTHKRKSYRCTMIGDSLTDGQDRFRFFFCIFWVSVCWISMKYFEMSE